MSKPSRPRIMRATCLMTYCNRPPTHWITFFRRDENGDGHTEYAVSCQEHALFFEKWQKRLISRDAAIKAAAWRTRRELEREARRRGE